MTDGGSGDLADDPGFRALRVEYAAAVAGAVAALRAALAAGAPGRDTAEGREFRRGAHNLRGTGASYGFPAITARAGVVEDLHLAGADARALREAVEELARAADDAVRALR